MKRQLEKVKEEFDFDLTSSNSQKDIENVRVKYLGKKGALTGILKQMGTLSADERPVIGKISNEMRNYISKSIEEKTAKLRFAETQNKLQSEKIDVTLPGKEIRLGHKHPMSIILDEVKDIFIGMGFNVVEGPDIESDYFI